MNISLFTQVFVTLFVIMDPVGTVPIFLSLTGHLPARRMRHAAWQAVAVSFTVISVNERLVRFPRLCRTISQLNANSATSGSPNASRAMGMCVQRPGDWSGSRSGSSLMDFQEKRWRGHDW